MLNASVIPSELRVLTCKQRVFVLEYVKDRNGTAAARIAGYKGSEKYLGMQASRLIGNDRVFSAIEALTKPALEKAEVTVERLVAELSRFAFGSLEQFARIKYDKEGNAIGATLMLRDKLTAIKMLGEYCGMFDLAGERLEAERRPTIPHKPAETPDQARAALLAFLKPIKHPARRAY